MIIEQLHDKDRYRELYANVFGTDCESVPPVVLVGRRGDCGSIVAFVAGFWSNSTSFYIQNGGVLPEFRKSGYLRYLASILDANVTYDMAVKNTNITMLKTALAIGFIPVGVHLQGGDLFVQLKREANG